MPASRKAEYVTLYHTERAATAHRPGLGHWKGAPPAEPHRASWDTSWQPAIQDRNYYRVLQNRKPKGKWLRSGRQQRRQSQRQAMDEAGSPY